MIYKTRFFESLQQWKVGQTKLKVYGISQHQNEMVDAGLVNQALAYTQQKLPVVESAEGHSESLGFSIIHKGEMGIWLLVHWWAHKDVCCQSMAFADYRTGEFVCIDDRPLHACVWEQVVICHERTAWIEKMMSGSQQPAAYLSSALNNGQY